MSSSKGSTPTAWLRRRAGESGRQQPVESRSRLATRRVYSAYLHRTWRTAHLTPGSGFSGRPEKPDPGPHAALPRQPLTVGVEGVGAAEEVLDEVGGVAGATG